MRHQPRRTYEKLALYINNVPVRPGSPLGTSCNYGILLMRSCTTVNYIGCDFFNNREYGLIDGRGCEICHPTENLGTIDMADQTELTVEDLTSGESA